MDPTRIYDSIIIGGGPAGLTAALYLARARYRVLVVEKEKFGGQITITSEVVNYPGVKKTEGTTLTETMRKQAESFGAEFLLAEVDQIDPNAEIKTVHTDKGNYFAFGLLIATGANPRVIGFPGEIEFRGRGVSYCATCDGEFFTGKNLYVIGGGFAAAEESVFLTKYANHVTILIREDDFTCAAAVAEKAYKHEKITVLTQTEVVEISGGNSLETLKFRNRKTGEETVVEAHKEGSFGIFVFAGYQPASDLVKGKVQLDSNGYIITDSNQKTNLEGVYAAGDICVKNLRQVVTAVSDGAIAATELEKHAAKLQEKTQIYPERPHEKSVKTESDSKPLSESELFSAEMQEQLSAVFSRMENHLILKLQLNKSDLSLELKQYMNELLKYTDKLSLQIEEESTQKDLPCVRILTADKTDTKIAFHGVPGGHEFTSFILGLYNIAGPGQPIEESIVTEIKAIDHPVEMQILVSLSCTMCPDLVIAAQRIAALNPLVQAEVYDLNHFPDLKDQYKVMSVPCLVINKDKVLFGKKNIKQLLAEI